LDRVEGWKEEEPSLTEGWTVLVWGRHYGGVGNQSTMDPKRPGAAVMDNPGSESVPGMDFQNGRSSSSSPSQSPTNTNIFKTVHHY
jgi:hypothetical protein